MPELPEVETIMRGLEPVLVSARFEHVSLKRSGLRYPFPEDFVTRLENQTVLSVKRRAKYMLASLSSGEVLLIHLGMSGRFLVEREHFSSDALERRHDHVIFHMSNGLTISYRDPRRFGFMDICPLSGISENRHLCNLGIEPLDDDLNGKLLMSLLQNKKMPLKTALLNQQIIAGLGNIYVCEALHQSRLHPEKGAATLTEEEADRLVEKIKSVLRQALEAGGSTLKDYAQTNGASGYFQHHFSVYGRENQPCQTEGCSGFIYRITQNGRSTFLCARCQKK